jgi:hypothetical protein
VHRDGFADDEAIADEFSDCLARVCVGDLAHFVRVEPDLALATADDGGREALLCAKVDPVDGEMLAVGLKKWGCREVDFVCLVARQTVELACTHAFDSNEVGKGRYLHLDAITDD